MTDVVEVEGVDQFNDILANNDRVLVKFSATWCGPCKQLKPHFDEAATRLDNVAFVEADVDSNPWATVDYGVRSVPTMMLFENGQYVKNVVGRTIIQIVSELKE